MATSNAKTADASYPTIGRYVVTRKLGAGSQGVVYLARDPDIGREVAIKTLTRHAGDEKSLLNEARNVGRLTHPHIATVFDIGTTHGTPYVVYEFIAGESLRSAISNGPLTTPLTYKWMGQLLAAIDYAHAQGIVHRDLNPNNIMITADGSAKVLDFGIATLSGTVVAPGDELVGTVNYMAPEQLSSGVIGPATDVFALGLITFEMLTGVRAVDLDDAMAAMYRIAHDELPLPSQIHPEVDKKFDIFVGRAIAKDPNERYLSARAMREALDKCACDEDPLATDAAESDGASKKSTLAFLIRRMRRKSDFPAMSERITEINQQTTSMESASVSELANTILKDYALTTKLLKLVNSSFYGQYGGNISTVSRAVVILGLKQVRMVTQSLLLFEHLGDKPHAKKLQEAASHAVLSGIIGRQVAAEQNIDATEEAFVCSMIHTLGRYLTLFYLPEEYADIQAAMEHRGLSEVAACLEVLGLSFEELGTGIAREWSFPDFLIDTMQPLPSGPIKRPDGEQDTLRAVTSFSNDLCQTLTTIPVDTRRMHELCKRFGGVLSVDEVGVANLVKRSLEDAKDYGTLITSGMETTQVFRAADAWSKGEDNSSSEQDGEATAGHEQAGSMGGQSSGSALVINGIQDITNALIEDCKLNDILSMIMETTFRGLGVTRVLLCIADRRSGKVVARLGLGQNLDRFIGKFAIPLKSPNDLFSAAIDKHVDLSFPGKLKAANLPAWYRKAVTPRFMALLPIVVNKTCLGALYCDIESSGDSLDAQQLNYLNTLRNQAALALKQSRAKS